MPLIKRVRRLLGERDDADDSGDVFLECRRCGTTLHSETDRCRACGARDVARYVIE